jgi:hypothetical protein
MNPEENRQLKIYCESSYRAARIPRFFEGVPLAASVVLRQPNTGF